MNHDSRPPKAPKAAIRKLAKHLDDALGIYQAEVRPYLLAMERYDAECGDHYGAICREAVRDDLTNHLHDAHYHARRLRDKVAAEVAAVEGE